MRQVVYVEPGRVEWREADDPSIEESTDALVRPLAVAACDIDRVLVRGLLPVAGPFPMGHELVGEVVETGDDVGAIRPGDLVAVPFSPSCGTCERCSRGLTAHCRTVPKGSMYGLGELGRGWPGALADVLRVPFAEHMLVPLPPGIDPASAASVSDNLPDAWRTVVPALEEWPGADVLVVSGGAPSIGLYAVMIARALGAGRIDYVDRSGTRRRLAGELGANPIEGPPPHRMPDRYPVTVDASADPEGLACAVRSTEAGGVCTSVGIYYLPETPMPLLDAYVSGITFRTGRPHARSMMPDILGLMATGRLDPDPIQTVVGWDDAPEALLDLPVKLVVSRDRD
ncbi:MAG: alcohol dehydrogenase catalytic domain-containing protein [Actinobacteria bacterium]|nr:alcohol dehydrogenase catalytic domain-containing protein [Actinomycetota bacterium]